MVFGSKDRWSLAPGGGRGGVGVRRANRQAVASSASKSRNEVSVRDRAREGRRERRQGWLTEAERRREAGSLRIWGGRGETTAGGGSDRNGEGAGGKRGSHGRFASCPDLGHELRYEPRAG